MKIAVFGKQSQLPSGMMHFVELGSAMAPHSERYRISMPKEMERLSKVESMWPRRVEL